ncbi:MAG: hypothetical protein ACTHOJ_07910 [Sphingomonas oligoaromativorans]|jgi:hypothetical protein|uniref:hypothetical protein n=1 Tax=Sphingomonas oligoaromativorans TaxID=575322 RepID=UPI00142125ED|nr:hypothetical protein [Sphingomonas oligoaromativorans]NIJ33770.1 hypothetical protein [Sphingomonas oligoaromativorans]
MATENDNLPLDDPSHSRNIGSEDDPSEYSSSRGVPAFARVGLLFATLAATAVLIGMAIAE